MYVGNVDNIVGHHFLLLSAGEYIYRLIECNERTFPFSDFARLHGILTSKHNDIKLYFITNYESTEIMDQKGLAKCCKKLVASDDAFGSQM